MKYLWLLVGSVLSFHLLLFYFADPGDFRGVLFPALIQFLSFFGLWFWSKERDAKRQQTYVTVLVYYCAAILWNFFVGFTQVFLSFSASTPINVLTSFMGMIFALLITVRLRVKENIDWNFVPLLSTGIVSFDKLANVIQMSFDVYYPQLQNIGGFLLWPIFITAIFAYLHYITVRWLLIRLGLITVAKL